MSKHCLILGAKSAMARAIAHAFAAEGYDLYLAARNPQDLDADVKDIAIRFRRVAKPIAFDAVDYGSHQAVWDALDPQPEVVVCAVGYMPDQKAAEQDSQLALAAMHTNYTGVSHFLNLVANSMEPKKAGCIIGISSVAGDRGRASNYFYGSAKAGFM
jgi:decaprenylphospho-beta-D-erythro-pentofuranosid-2-ulose 2-reductase